MYILFSAFTSTVTILFKAGFKGMYNALIFRLVTADLSFGAFPFPVPSDNKQVILMCIDSKVSFMWELHRIQNASMFLKDEFSAGKLWLGQV